MTRSLFLLIAAFSLLFKCEPLCAQQQNIVARIAGNYTITFPQLKEYATDHQYVYMYRNSIAEALDQALANMILNRLKIIDFFNRGLNEKEALLHGIMRVLNEDLVSDYYRTQVYGKYVSEAAIRNVYRKMWKEVIYRQIVLLKPKSASRNTVDSLEPVARTLGMRIEGGADFYRLAKRYSQDERSAGDGGAMPPLTWKMSLSSAMYDSIFHLPVYRVGLLESNEAIHIVKVDRIDTVRVPPYSEAKAAIRKALGEKYVYAASNDFDRLKQRLVDERTVQWNEKGVGQLLRWSNIPKFYESAYADTLGHAISHGNNFLILKYSGGTVDLKEYLRLVNDVLTLGNAAPIKESDFKQYILEAVRTDKIVKMARKLNLLKDVFNPGTRDDRLVNGIIRIYNEQVIDRQIPPATDKALEAFYRANRDSLYYQLAKVNIYAVIDSSRGTVEKAKEKLARGVAFEKLARTIQVRAFVRKRDGTIASYLSIKPPYLGKAAFKLKLHETAGPIGYIDSSKGRKYALIKCMAVRKEKQLTFDNVKRTIGDDFAEYHRKKIAQSVAEQLRKKYGVKIYEDVIRRNLLSSGVSSK